MSGWGIRFGSVEGEGQAGVGDHVDAFVGEVEVAHDLVVEVLGSGAVVADVVGTPAAAKLLTPRGQFADEVVQVLVVGGATGFGGQDGDAGVRGAVPVAVEVMGGVEVEEGEAGEVRR